MENSTDKIDHLVNIFNTYRSDVSTAVKKGTIMQDRFDLQDKLYKILGELGVSLIDMQNNEYINKVSFGSEDKTFLMIKNIEDQIEDVFTRKTDKTIKEIYEEKEVYIDGLHGDQKHKYNNLKTDPLFYLLMGSTYEGEGNVVSVIDERQFADDILKNKEKKEKTKEIEDFLGRSRAAYIEAIHNDTLYNTALAFRAESQKLGIKDPYSFDEVEYIIDNCMYQGRKVYRSIRHNILTILNHEEAETPLHNVLEEDMNLFTKITEDIIYHKLIGSTGSYPENTEHILDDKKLAQVLYELSQK